MSDDKLRYLRNITWMIEVRDWPDGEAAPEAGAVSSDEKRNLYAPADVVNFGTGVLIQLEQLDDEDKPLSSPDIRNYILTCGHVVRLGEKGDGPIGKEILCWNPAYSYQRTHAVRLGEGTGRKKGESTGAHLAQVSPLSPFDSPAAINLADKDKHLDWVLLKLKEVESRPGVDAAFRVEGVSKPEPGGKVFALGYAGGAGWEKDRQHWIRGKQFWGDGHPLEAVSSGKCKIKGVSDHVIHIRGAVNTRAGMSGGGIFSVPDQRLVGLHRSRDDNSLKAEALCVADILQWLKDRRHVRPRYPEKEVPPPPPVYWKWALGIAAAAALATLIYAFQPDPPPRSREFVWRGVVRERVEADGTVTYRPVDGAKVLPHLNFVDMPDMEVTTPSPADLGPGEFEITTNNSAFYYQPAKLKISKEGYKTLIEEANAIPPREDNSHRQKYTLRKVNEP